MTRLVLGRLIALMALLGLFAMHGFTAGHDSGHCLAPSAGTDGHHAQERAAPAVGDHATAMNVPVTSLMTMLPAAGSVAIMVSAAAGAPGGLVVGEAGCGPLGVAGMCLAVLLAPLLLALVLAVRRGWALPKFVTAAFSRGLPAHLERVGRIRGPSLAQLCVMRT